MRSRAGTAPRRPGRRGPSRRRPAAPDLTLPRLRHRWNPSPGAASPLNMREIYAQAAEAAQLAAEDIKAGKRGANHTAWAAADLLTAVADASGNHELQKAADGF